MKQTNKLAEIFKADCNKTIVVRIMVKNRIHDQRFQVVLPGCDTEKFSRQLNVFRNATFCVAVINSDKFYG